MSDPLPDPLPRGVRRGLAEPAEARPAAEPEDIPPEVHASGLLPGGLDVTLVYRGTARQLGKVLRQVERSGLAPRARDFPRTAEGLPIRPRHHIVMKKSEKRGDEWFSHQVKGPRGEELYRRGHAGPDSPGRDAPNEGRS
ncbi:MAG TPA: hypothetical protein VG406_03660 [Isosphaeraceae bacterium]|jgi:hypothetical protein|nr:hypothetical protein [Isosphaeraceae bacterium]